MTSTSTTPTALATESSPVLPSDPPGALVPTGTPAGTAEETNVFSSLASLVNELDTALDHTEDGKALCNWRRISHIRLYSKPQADPAIVKGVKKGVVIALVPAILGLVKLVIKAQEMLDQLDSAKALGEVSLDTLSYVASPSFFQPFEELFGLPNPISASTGGTVKSAVDTIKNYVNKIPSTEDLDSLGRSLAKLIVLRYKPDGSLDVENTGSLRLLWWALADQAEKLSTLLTQGNDTSIEAVYQIGVATSDPVAREIVAVDLGDVPDKSRPLFNGFDLNDYKTDLDSLFKSTPYKNYHTFRASCVTNATDSGPNNRNDEVALNRLWGVDISDPSEPKLAPLPMPVAPNQGN